MSTKFCVVLTGPLSSLLIANADVSLFLRMLMTQMLAPDADFVSLLAEASPSMPPVALIYPSFLAEFRLGHTCGPLNSPSSRGEVDAVVIRATLMYLYPQRTKIYHCLLTLIASGPLPRLPFSVKCSKTRNTPFNHFRSSVAFASFFFM